MSADLPENLAASRTIKTLLTAEAEGRLPHALLFSGESAENLEAAMFALSAKILGGNAVSHPDFHYVRPENKMRRISIENTLQLVRKIQQSPLIGERKIACVYEPERMGRDAANAFLKTLEEPPAGTTIFLLSGAINQVLPTIRSRCLHFRIHGTANFEDARWSAWLEDFSRWICALREGKMLRDIGTGIFSIYGLVTRFEAILDSLTEEAWEKLQVPETATADQRDAMREGMSRGMRRRLLAGIEDALLSFACDPASGKVYVPETAKSCELLEHFSGLLELNAQVSVALEAFLLNCLRIWTKRK